MKILNHSCVLNVIAFTLFYYLMKLPLVSEQSLAESDAKQSRFSSAGSILLRLRGGSSRRNRVKPESQLLRKWRGQSLGVIDGREIEGPIPPPAAKNSKMVFIFQV